MATTTTVVEQLSAPITAVDDGRMKMDGSDPSYGDWRDELLRDGYAVIKGAIPRERADGYADKMYALLESFGLGYDRNDPSTVHPDKLPVINEKGMLMSYGACHEDFVWSIRSEPGVVGAFEKVYNTEDLIVSFDDPEKPGFRCLQGLVNLHPCGPNNGGLIVCKGSHNLSAQFHKDLKDEPRIPAWTKEWYGFTDRGMQWLADHGGEWIKVCADPGDLIVWDSRTAHYNVPVKGEIDRMAVYTCFMPVTDATQEDLVRKKAAYEARLGTTHWPNARHTGSNAAVRNGKPDHVVRERPLNDPVLSGRAFKLTGIPYIRSEA
ncbi:phytanoyl- dioxygenase [Colletotrichum sojae]|uniref:Phytanoyl- dioxygenase n=1 Tax=Colletotrichum sojae TaxID=2175907 RepID=A0A8H6IVQ4_9PEZI|nr:phytanoyl- dioxygenase [Colletotrichum sojae]